MSSKSTTAFVLVPGSFSPPSFYERVISLLTAAPHSYSPAAVQAITLPSIDSERAGGPATLYDDAYHIARAIEGFADQGLDVVLAMNSYGGFPGSEACKNLSKSARSQAGKQGGVTALVYIAAFLPAVGQTVKSITGGMPGDEPYMTLPPKSPEFAQAIFCDLTLDKAEQYFDRMTKHSRASFEGELTYAAYKDIETWYMHEKKDTVLKPEWQLEWVEKARKGGADVE